MVRPGYRLFWDFLNTVSRNKSLIALSEVQGKWWLRHRPPQPVLEKSVGQLGLRHWNSAVSLDQCSIGVWPRISGIPKGKQRALPPGYWATFQAIITSHSGLVLSATHTWVVYSRTVYCLQMLLAWLLNCHSLWALALLGCSHMPYSLFPQSLHFIGFYLCIFIELENHY